MHLSKQSTDLHTCSDLFPMVSLVAALVMMELSSEGADQNTTSFPVVLAVAKQPLGMNTPRFKESLSISCTHVQEVLN